MGSDKMCHWCLDTGEVLSKDNDGNPIYEACIHCDAMRARRGRKQFYHRKVTRAPTYAPEDFPGPE